MITIRNTQRSIPLDKAHITNDVRIMLEALDYADFDIGIWFTTDRTIQKYNRDYRKKDKPTDILSFPCHPLKPGDRIVARDDDDKNIGDLIICPSYVKKDAPQWGQSFEERMRILLAHGICHLLGYDHISDEDYEIMHKKEQWLISKLP